jgi:hypothetical protein
MPLQEIECMGAQVEVALQICLEHEGVGALGGGKGPSAVFPYADRVGTLSSFLPSA